MDEVAVISTANTQAIAIRIDGSVWAWGNNWSGQLGDGTTSHPDRPVNITRTIAAIMSSSAHP